MDLMRSRKGNIILLLLAAVAFLAVVVGGYYWWQNWQLKPVSGRDNQAIKIIPSVSPTPTVDETANWKTYENTQFSFKLAFPYGYTFSKPFISDGRNFWGCFDLIGKDSSYCIKINMNGEITPPFLTDTSGCPICETESRTTFLGKQATKISYSTQKGISNLPCPSTCTKDTEHYITNEHSVELGTCVAKDQTLYKYSVGGRSEAELLCQNGDSLYRFSLVCKGAQWSGKDGQNRCSSLFDQILSTFQFLDQIQPPQPKYGQSTYEVCNVSSDCQKNGCSGEICGRVNGPSGISSCLQVAGFVSPTAEGFSCSCVIHQCQWKK